MPGTLVVGPGSCKPWLHALVARSHVLGEYFVSLEGVDLGTLAVGARWCGHGLIDVYPRPFSIGLLLVGLWGRETWSTPSSVGLRETWLFSAAQEPYAARISSVRVWN